MKLYYSPGACSLAPHIALREAGLPFTLVRVTTKTHKLDDGTDYYGINPKGYVPLLELDNGQRLSEGPVISQYVADQAPAKKLAPANGTMERYRLQEWLNFLTSELHKGYSPLWNADMPDAAKSIAKHKLGERYKWIEAQLQGKQFLTGDTFTIADAYLFTVTTWAGHVGVDLSAFKNVAAFQDRVSKRPAVQEALKAEGLLK